MIYLDHNATSPLLPEVLEAMLPWLGVPANPSSVHQAGQRAAAAVERARDQVAALVGGRAEGVVFTSGATEANHLAIRALTRGRLVIGPLEHPCVQAAAAVVAERVEVQVLGARPDGTTEVPSLPADTRLVALMAANHETGVLQPLDEARAAAEAVGAGVHVDATQAAGRVALHLGWAASVALSGHKLGGPGGTGALVLPDSEPFPALFAGSQERGRRGGTVNTAGVVGFGLACAIAQAEQAERAARYATVRALLEAGLVALGGRIVGASVPRVPQTTLAIFSGVRGEALVQALDLRGICVSSGAACASGSVEASPVLLAMGDPEPEGALRVSLGPASSEHDVHALLAALPPILTSIREAAAWSL